MKPFFILGLLAAASGQAQAFDASLVQRWACYARSDHGYTFEGLGRTLAEAQNSALARCYRRSAAHHCEAAQSCRVVYLRQGD